VPGTFNFQRRHYHIFVLVLSLRRWPKDAEIVETSVERFVVTGDYQSHPAADGAAYLLAGQQRFVGVDRDGGSLVRHAQVVDSLIEQNGFKVSPRDQEIPTAILITTEQIEAVVIDQDDKVTSPAKVKGILYV